MGAYFAIGTWVVAEVFRLSFAQIQALGGWSGSSLPVSIVKSIASSKAMRESLIYWMILGLTVLILVSVAFCLRNIVGFSIIPLFILFITKYQIIPEEEVLESIFGQEYLRYINKVRRWI